jgi:hypothetical protein
LKIESLTVHRTLRDEVISDCCRDKFSRLPGDCRDSLAMTEHTLPHLGHEYVTRRIWVIFLFSAALRSESKMFF